MPRVAPAPPDEGLRELSSRLGPGLRLGTSSWSFPGWAGIVYAASHGPGLLAREGLGAYARHPLLRTVGLDRGFYRPLAAEELAGLAEQVPDDFRFVVKAHEDVSLARFPSHPRYGARAGETSPRFLDASYAADALIAPLVAGLGAKAGVLLFQFPPHPPGVFDDPGHFAEALHRFLVALPGGVALAVEIRNREWLTPAYADALRDAGAVHVFNVHPRMPRPSLQARAVDAREGPLVVRWMLGGRQSYDAARTRYQPFDRLVDEDPEARREIAELCRSARARSAEAYVVVNNKAEGSAPLSVVGLARELGGGATLS